MSSGSTKSARPASPGASRSGQTYAGPGAGAHRDKGFEFRTQAAARSGGTDQLHQIVLEAPLHLHRLHRAACRQQIGLAQGERRRRQGVAAGVELEDGQLHGGARVVHQQLEQEAIELGLRQGIGPS